MNQAAAAFLILLVASPAVYAVDHVVGGNSGWSQSVNYGSWASGETFTVGDSLVFNYDNSHSVDEVNQDGYTNCDSSRLIKSYTGGKTTIRLDNPGQRYFLCPSLGHCGQGMKLSVNVVAATTPGGSPSPPPSGSTSPPDAPPSSPTPPSTTPPPPSGAPGGIGNLMVLVLAPLMLMLLAFIR